MALVRSFCSQCDGDVSVDAGDVEVIDLSYRFLCPKCERTSVRSANERSIELLLLSGCVDLRSFVGRFAAWLDSVDPAAFNEVTP